MFFNFKFNLFQTCEKRKALLDEMAIRVQTKSDESNSRISKLEEELNSYKNRLQVGIKN
jgi:hypothetical protein